jgi:hypothetical protein
MNCLGGDPPNYCSDSARIRLLKRNDLLVNSEESDGFVSWDKKNCYSGMVAVLSGGNVNLDQRNGLKWN